MALISYSAAPSKGASVTATLDKTELLSIDAVTADAWWAQESSIATAVLTLESEPGKAKIVLQFDFTQSPCTAEVSFPAYTRDVFQIAKIVLIDTMGDKLTLNRATLLAQAPTFGESEIELGGGGPPPPSGMLIAIDELSSEGSYLKTAFYINYLPSPQGITTSNPKDIATDGTYFWFVGSNNRLQGTVIIDGATSLNAIDVLSDSRVVLGGYSDDQASGAVFVQDPVNPNQYNTYAIFPSSNVFSVSVAKSINDVYTGSINADYLNEYISADLSVYQDSTGMVMNNLTSAFGGALYSGGNLGIDVASPKIKVFAKNDSSAVVMLSSYTEKSFGIESFHANIAQVAKADSAWSPQILNLTPPTNNPDRVFPDPAWPIPDNACYKDAVWDGNIVYVSGFMVDVNTLETKPGYWTANMADAYPGSSFIELDTATLGSGEYTGGVAESITVIGNAVHIFGWARDPNSGATKAVEWVVSAGNPTITNDRSDPTGLTSPGIQTKGKFIGKT